MNSPKASELTRPADLAQHGKGTGAVRTRHPVYVDLLPPCNNACPAGEDIQGWLAHAQEGAYAKAWQALIRDNPLPAVHGRVCYHPCESHCNRREVDSAVSIHAVERFLGDLALQRGWKVEVDAPPSGRRIMVVGAGPSGLSAAYHLTRLGHTVEIFEAGPMAGGMLHFGIPAYRLPRVELDREIARIEEMGVRMEFNHKVEDVVSEKEAGQFDAVFIAVGAHLSKRVEIPARDAGKIFDAVSFLRQASSGETPTLGRRVAIYGGGNTAMDAARTARRLGAEEALIIYRRDREHMPAHAFEADDAIEEGVKINWLRTIKEIDQSKIQVEVMQINAQGYPEPTGQFETLEADTLTIYHNTDVADEIIAEGNPAKMRQQPELDKAIVHARARVITYYKNEDRVHLQTDARIEQEGAVVDGDAIDYFIAKQLITAESDQSREDDKVVVVIPPSVHKGSDSDTPDEQKPGAEASPAGPDIAEEGGSGATESE